MTHPPHAPWRAEAALGLPYRSAWCGPSLLVLETGGGVGGGSVAGWYFREARHLSAARLELFGEAPALASFAAGPQAIEQSFVYPEAEEVGGGGSGSGGSGERHGVPTRGLDLFLGWRVRPASIELTLRLTSRWRDDLEVDLAWALGADFADLQQALAGEAGPGAAATAIEGGVLFACDHPELPLATRATAGGARWRWDGGRLRTTLLLARQETAELTLRLAADDAADPLDEAGETAREERLAAWRRSLTRLSAPGGDAFVTMADAAMADLGSLALLDGAEDEWLAPAAGIPYYPAFFARDALTAGWQATVLDQGQLLAAAHAKAGRLIGRADDPWRDEQPGRIVQQARRGPLARLGVNPFDRYYGDYASPLMFVISLGQLYAWTGDRRALARSWPAAMAALAWAERHGDRDGDGWLEYLTLSPAGPKHQGWKDSDNAVVDERGEQVEPPFAAAELQGYWFAALEIASVLALFLGRPGTAFRLARRARRLKRRFDRDFWLPE
ncbi:MAG TPA: glycogen debranching N-terminal domain-containing protein, partial [Thermoanaerobaculia bacterium]